MRMMSVSPETVLMEEEEGEIRTTMMRRETMLLIGILETSL